jgi:hypothetical protein
MSWLASASELSLSISSQAHVTILRGDLKDGAQWTEPAEIEVGAHNGSPQRGLFLEDFKLQKMVFL